MLALTATTVAFVEPFNIGVGTTNGPKIGTSATQKLGFWNTTPVIQFSAAGTTIGFTAATWTEVISGYTFTGNLGSGDGTIGELVAALKKCGIIAT